MNFGQRLFRYLIGVTIGCALVYMMFPNYNWLGWTPENQIMKNIRESSVSMGSKANCQMACLGIGWELVNAARQNGRILFNESNTRSTPKKYHLQYEEYAFKVLMLSDSTAEIADVVMAGTVCDCQ